MFRANHSFTWWSMKLAQKCGTTLNKYVANLSMTIEWLSNKNKLFFGGGMLIKAMLDMWSLYSIGMLYVKPVRESTAELTDTAYCITKLPVCYLSCTWPCLRHTHIYRKDSHTSK